MLNLCFCLPELTKVLTNGPLGILQNLNHICICKHLTIKLKRTTQNEWE